MYNNKLNPDTSHHTLLNPPQPRSRRAAHLSIGVLKLQFLFDIEKLSTKLLITSLVSVFIGFYSFFLLERTGLYSLGITSFFQAIARCVSYFLGKGNGNDDATLRILHASLFWGLALLFNIPLAVIGYKKVGSHFTLLSILAVTISSLTSIILSSLPASWGLKDFFIFSDPRTFNTCLTSKKINILQWSYLSVIKENGSSSSTSYVTFNDSSNIALIFFYGFVFGLLNTVTSLIIYALGGSTGGMDWIVFYLSKKRMHSTSSLILYLSLTVTFVSYLIGSYIPYVDYMTSNGNNCPTNNGTNGASGSNTLQTYIDSNFNAKRKTILSTLVGPTLIATTIAAITKKIIFNFFYPHFKLINVKIFTNKFLELRKLLLSSDFPHSFTINTAIGGYLLRTQTVFDITCFALELKTLKEHTRKIDPDCLIVATPIKSLSGKFIVRDNLK